MKKKSISSDFLLLTIGFVLFWSSSLNTSSQDKADYALLIPPSPNAGSIARHTEAPVSLSAGTANISIPIWTIITTNHALPIYLKYYPSGVLVEEIASWVGLGWTLEAGGLITRVMRGLPDESVTKGYCYSSDFQSETFQPASELGYYSWAPNDNTMEKAATGDLDTEPDIFYFNVNGLSGKFTFDGDGGIILSPYQKVSLVPTISNGKIVSWVITNVDGTKYYFGSTGATESTELTKVCTGISTTPNINEFNSTWYVTKIESPRGDDDITFNYTSETYTYETFSSEELLYDIYEDVSIDGYITCKDSIELSGYRLNKISFPGGYVEFDGNTTRNDLSTKRLDEIEIYDSDDNLIKEFLFTYGYFGSGSGYNSSLHLRLDELKERFDASNENPPYKFTYESTVTLPARTSKQQDHWGYYNGATSNDTENSLLDSVEVISGTFDGVDREPDGTYTKAGVLTKIENPFGGTITYEYEPNDYRYYTGPANWESTTIDASQIIEKNTNDCGSIWNDTYDDINTFYVCTTEIIDIYYYFSTDDSPLHNATVQILDINDNNKWNASFGSDPPQQGNCYIKEDTDTLTLSQGWYKLRTLNIDNKPEIYASLMVTYDAEVLDYSTNSLTENIIGPGLRIKKTTQHDGFSTANDRVVEYKYRQISDNNKSSGVLLTKPYYFNFVDLHTDEGNNHFVRLSWIGTPYLKLFAVSQSAPGLYEGNILRYDEVQVLDGANGTNGKTVYTFTSPLVYPDTLDYAFRRTLRQDYKWKTGAPGISYILDKDGIQKSRKTYDYNPIGDTDNRKIARGYRSAYPWRSSFTHNNVTYDPVGLSDNDEGYIDNSYKLISEWTYRTKEYSYIYDENGLRPNIDSTLYYFDNPDHIQLTKVVQTRSDSLQTISYIRYPEDYIDGTSDYAASAITEMKSLGIHNALIEKQQCIKRPEENEKLVSGEIIKYKEFATDQILPNEILQLKETDPLFSFDTSEVSGGTFQYDSHYEVIIASMDYDTRGNLIEQNPADFIPNALLYGHSKTLSVAQFVNASNNQIYYQSFEEETGGAIKSDTAKTGEKCYEGDYSVPFTIPTGENYSDYQISYWYYENGDWKFSEPEDYSSSFNANKGTRVDEIRVLPWEARMTTYNYKPLIGLISETDVNGFSVYYYYDKLGRLLVVRDQDKNILKKITYNYKE